MKATDLNKKFKQDVRSSINKIERAKKNRGTVLAQTVYLGSIGIIFILPIIIGAYVGVWLDNKMQNFFSISWTISLIIVGVVVGAINVYYFIKE